MAHFARIDADNIVIEVLVVPDEQEHRGETFLRDDLQLGGRWIQTSYNNRIRKQYAGKGYSYDPINDVFIAPQPAPWFTLNNNFDWVCPENIDPQTGKSIDDPEVVARNTLDQIFAILREANFEGA